MLTRRNILKFGALVGSALLLLKGLKAPGALAKRRSRDRSGKGGRSDDVDSRGFATPRLKPFVDRLPIPPVAQEVSAFTPVPDDIDFTPEPDPLACPNDDRSNARLFQLVEEEALVKFHSELPLTRAWRYRDINTPESSLIGPGPTFAVRMGLERKTIFVRHLNRLPPDHEGFGVPCSTVHLHGAHIEARSDGFPENVPEFPAAVVFAPPAFSGAEPHPGIEPPSGCEPGAPTQYDYCYEMRDPGFSHGADPFRPNVIDGSGDPTERPSTMWYHDHLFDFTGPNVVRGLAGFYLVFDELDNGDESDENEIGAGHYAGRKPLGLPSGEFDIGLVFGSRLFDEDGQLVYLPGDHDGFLGDTTTVNGAIQPFLDVKRRKYRFRLLAGTNARILGLFLTNDSGETFSFDEIANAGGLFSEPIRDSRFVMLAPALRRELIIDSSQFNQGDVLYLEDRIDHDDGRGPGGKFDDPDLKDRGKRLIEFRVGADAQDSRPVPDVLRPFDAISAAEITEARKNTRTFRFDRRHGAWAINNELAELEIEHSVAFPKANTPEIWRLINKSGGWWHPIHIHLEFMRVLSRNGETPPLEERDGFAKKDTVLLGPNSEVEVLFKFRDYPGPWVFHCHNIEHEDMRMMARFDVVS